MQVFYKKIVLVVVLLIITGFLINRVLLASKLRNKTGSASQQDQPRSTQKTLAINGIQLDSSSTQRPFAVIVDNHVDSRPQSGLSQADLVYEALAEGGITRFLAVFQTEDVNSIGPVRSARTYFNDWAAELKAIFVHVGGNSDALYYLKQGIAGISDADQFFNDRYFVHISSRQMPHNTYTSTAKLLALAKAHNYDLKPNFESYLFKDQKPAQEVEQVTANSVIVNKVTVDFSLPNYKVSWIYDPIINNYVRYLAGQKVIDSGNNQEILAKNIIVQRVANWPVQSDTLFAISMGTRSGGAAQFFLDGKKIEGTWQFVNGRTKFFDQDRQEMRFNRGKIWLEIVPPDNAVISE